MKETENERSENDRHHWCSGLKSQPLM